MSSNPTILVQNVSKVFHIYERPKDRLKQFIYPKINALFRTDVKKHYVDFWALRNVSLEVNKGEAVGILGRNGAGKSTLLQIIAGTLSPTSGDVLVTGTVAALLELGSSFNSSLSGVENIYLAGAVLGLSQEQMDDRFDAIASFADVGEFINQPLSTYSSGMAMRLAFAVNTCIEPEVLIVDEALSVGDAPFQAKCFKRLRGLLDSGTSILFVSHDKDTVRALCSRALWIKNGEVAGWGNAKDIAKDYERFCWEQQGVNLGGAKDESNDEVDKNDYEETSTSLNVRDMIESSIIAGGVDRTGTFEVAIKAVNICNSRGDKTLTFKYGEKLYLTYLIELNRDISEDFVLGLRFKDIKGNFVCSFSAADKVYKLQGNKGDSLLMSFDIECNLQSGDYVALTGIFGFNDGRAFAGEKYDFNKSVMWDLIDDAFIIKIARHPLDIPGPTHQAIELDIKKI